MTKLGAAYNSEGVPRKGHRGYVHSSTWYVVERYPQGWRLLEGAGPHGGQWMAKKGGTTAIFFSRKEAEEFINDCTIGE